MVRLTLPRAAHLHDLLDGRGLGLGHPAVDNPVGLQVLHSGPSLQPIPRVITQQIWSGERAGVYIITTGEGDVLYVGSIHRTTSALAGRLSEHFRHRPQRHGRWTHVALLGLPQHTGRIDVRWCEGVVGRSLDPIENERLPAVPGRPSWSPRAVAA
jgi:hypothetical protein